MAAPAAKPSGKGGAENSLMSAVELKPLLHLAKRRPLNCAIAMSKGKVGIILIHRRTKPKKLLAELKTQAKAKGIELDTTSLRFGRVSVDGASDAGMATFTVNKPAPGPMRRALLEQVRPAGLQRCEILVDEGLENEAEEGDAESQAHAGPTAGATDAEAGTAPPHADGGQAQGGVGPDAPPGPSLDGTSAPGPAAPWVPPGQPGLAGAGGQQGAGPALAPADPVRARLASLGLRAKEALASGSPQAGGIRAAVVQARSALASGDTAQAGQAADAMERLLGTGPSATAEEEGAQGDAPVSAADGERSDAGTGGGGPPSTQPDQAAVLKADLLEVAQRIVSADPVDRRRLVGLGNQARAAIEAGNTAQATAGIQALRQALPAGGPPAAAVPPSAAPARPPQDGEQPGFAAAALRAGFDARAAAAPDRTGWTQVADGAPGNRAIDAGPAPPAAGQPASAQPASGGGALDTARSYVGSLGTNVVGGLLGTPSALASGLDWMGWQGGMTWGLQDRLHGVRDPSNPNQPLFPTPAEAHQMAYNTTGVREYVPKTRAGRLVQAGLEGAMTGGAGALVTAPLRAAGGTALGGAVRAVPAAVAVGGVGGASGQAAAEAAPEGYQEVAAVVGGLVGGGLAAGARGAVPRARGRVGPGEPVAPPAQAPAVPDAVPPPITMRGAENPRLPPAGLPATYGPATGNVPQAAVKGTTRLDLSGRPPASPEPARLAPPPEQPPLVAPTAEQQVQALPGHGHERHGMQTTLAEQEHRLRTGMTPDSRLSPTKVGTRFSSHEAELDAVRRAVAIAEARDAAGLLPDAIRLPRPGASKKARNANLVVVVTGFPGGYGSGLRSQGKGAQMTISPTGQYMNARITLERNPITGAWEPVGQFPSDEPVTPP